MDLPQFASQVCDLYSCTLLAELADAVIGVYIHGSVALGDFQDGASDIDFVTVINRVLTEQELTVLSGVHAGRGGRSIDVA